MVVGKVSMSLFLTAGLRGFTRDRVILAFIDYLKHRQSFIRGSFRWFSGLDGVCARPSQAPSPRSRSWPTRTMAWYSQKNCGCVVPHGLSQVQQCSAVVRQLVVTDDERI